MQIVIFGPPGSGKGTQSKLLVEQGWVQLSTGDMLRAAATEDSERGRHIKSLIDNGIFASDELVLKLIDEQLIRHDGKNIIFDGFPRNCAQAFALDELLTVSCGGGCKIDAVVELSVDQDVLLQRITDRFKTDGRADDNPETFAKRMATYFEKTAPVLDYYGNTGVREIKVDGMAAIKDVHAKIVAALKKA
jgi:adenylate kinase